MYLVIGRGRGESVMVGDWEVKVSDIRGDKVRLAFNFPRELPIHKKETYDAIRRENREKAIKK